MNPLEKLKDKLRVKPTVEEIQNKKVYIVIPIPNKEEAVNLEKMTIVDKTAESKFDMNALKKRMEDKRLGKITLDSSLQKEKEFTPLQEEVSKKIPAKKRLRILQDEGVPIFNVEDIELQKQVQQQEQPLAQRTTKRVQTGVAELPPEAWVQIGESDIISRLPEKKQKVYYKTSSYYMNNREIFVNFINSLFEPYRNEVLNDSSDISCDTIGNIGSDEVELLSHQKMVRDYLNLYTPYRGLLLYHSLGSGKSLSSIAIAEGMKDSKKVIVMTPASLESNYRIELKKFDSLYKSNQFWEWIDIQKNPEALPTLSSILSLPIDYIQSKKGAWLTNVTKPASENNLTQEEKKSLDQQIDKMIEMKYEFIHYNGIRRDKLRRMTDNFTVNIFDNAVIIIDEAHNFISRIVNKINKEKPIEFDKEGKKNQVYQSMFLILYEMLMTAQNCRIVLLTGTPIINYPNEIGILFNILRGYIKTWEFPLDITGSKKVDKDVLKKILEREKSMDYMDYSPSNKQLIITRNPYGFENKIKVDSGYLGVTNEKKDPQGNPILEERGTISDEDFQRKIIRMLQENGIEVIKNAIRINMYKALPDKLDAFTNWFIEEGTVNIKNPIMFQKRIMGLTSYFRSAQEKLLPRYERLSDFHVLKLPMSQFQFSVYESARQEERKQEKNKNKNKGKPDVNGIFKEPSSTYRIFSRLYCNFVFPKEIGRPLPREDKEEKTQQEEGDKQVTLTALSQVYGDALTTVERSVNENEEEPEGDEIIEKLGDTTYEFRLKKVLELLKQQSTVYLTPQGLQTYSPKFLSILENIQDESHPGLHLVYSQFRTLEGIGIFKLVLEQNGFTQFKIKKDSNAVWTIDIAEEEKGKPTFALYTGTETTEEKEMLRKIYNGSWQEIPPSLSSELKKIATNNNMGEIIKVFMITASGSEGINLRNTRYVHIMEPYWHPARIEQVVGRARRICSHKDLPEELQTVEVFLYLMTFTKEQIDSDEARELRANDKSKREYEFVSPKGKVEKREIPFTSDEALFEISTIKEDFSSQLMKAIKESSIDCAIYAKRGAKEQLHCLSFGEPSANSFSFHPSITDDETDVVSKQNKKTIEWRGKEVKIYGKDYIYRKIDSNIANIYDVESYKRAIEIPGENPVLIGTLEKDASGKQVFKKI